MGVCEGPFDNGLATTERDVHQLASLLCLQLDGLGKTDRRLGILLHITSLGGHQKVQVNGHKL